MKNYYPERMDLGPRDVVARSNFNETGTKTWRSLVGRNPFTKEKNFGKTPNYVRPVQTHSWN